MPTEFEASEEAAGNVWLVAAFGMAPPGCFAVFGAGFICMARAVAGLHWRLKRSHRGRMSLWK